MEEVSTYSKAFTTPDAVPTIALLSESSSVEFDSISLVFQVENPSDVPLTFLIGDVKCTPETESDPTQNENATLYYVSRSDLSPRSAYPVAVTGKNDEAYYSDTKTTDFVLNLEKGENGVSVEASESFENRFVAEVYSYTITDSFNNVLADSLYQSIPELTEDFFTYAGTYSVVLKSYNDVIDQFSVTFDGSALPEIELDDYPGDSLIRGNLLSGEFPPYEGEFTCSFMQNETLIEATFFMPLLSEPAATNEPTSGDSEPIEFEIDLSNTEFLEEQGTYLVSFKWINGWIFAQAEFTVNME